MSTRTSTSAASPCTPEQAARTPIAWDAPSEKAAAENEAFEALRPHLTACLATSPPLRYSIGIELAPTGRIFQLAVSDPPTAATDCALHVIVDELCMAPFEGEWSTEWTLCARGCTDSPYCRLCVE